ncbi:MAG: hypothetical protein U0324_28580 [Polyangiales bacterium]
MRPVVAAVLAVVLPLPAAAYAPPRDVPSRPPDALVALSGRAVVRGAWARVRCDVLVLTETFATCRVEARFDVAMPDGGSLTPNASPDDAIRFDGAPAQAQAVPAGGTVRVTLTATRGLSTDTRWRGGPWVLSPLAARHPFFGEASDVAHTGGNAAVTLYAGEDVTQAGEVALDADGDGVVTVRADPFEAPFRRREAYTTTVPDEPPARVERGASVSMSLGAREAPERSALRNGGPVLAFGMRGPVDRELSRGLYRVGWEVALFEYVFVQGALETDGDSLFESAVVDVSSPELAVIVPSLRLGVGAVARQLGPRPADGALRLRVGGNLLPMGFDVDFDYWPAVTEWTLTVACRLSP